MGKGGGHAEGKWKGLQSFGNTDTGFGGDADDILLGRYFEIRVYKS